MDRRSALMWPPLMSWLMVTGSTRSTLTWSTHPGQGNSSQAFMSSCSWSTLVFLVQLADVDASLCFELMQVWREDLLCGGARQSEQTSGYWLGYVAVCLSSCLYTCLSTHLSSCRLSSDPSMPESERNKIAIGASGLILGLILSLAGFIYYRRKVRGNCSIPAKW